MALAGAVLGLLIASGLGLLVFVNTEAPERPVEWTLPFALGGVYGLPAVLALIALRGRPALLPGAALLSGVLSLSSAAGATWPLLIPTVLYFTAYRRWSPRTRAALPTATVTAITFGLGLVAFLVLLLHADPMCWAKIGPGDFVRTFPSNLTSGISFGGAQEGGCTSDVVLPWEGIVTLGLVGLTTFTAAVAATPRQNPAGFPPSATIG